MRYFVVVENALEKQILYDFHINKWTPDTLPMNRLADYLVELAKLFGNEDQVHFLKVNKGSAVPVIEVEPAANQKVQTRLRLVNNSDAPADLVSAHKKINQYLREDNTSAYLKPRTGAKILEFKGVKTPISEELVLHEAGALEGAVIKLGGKDDTVPVTLQGENGVFYRCNTKREIAKQLASYLFGEDLRVHGRGKWIRNEDGIWKLDEFDIQSFELLNNEPLENVVKYLREIDGSGWNEIENPHEELKKLRGE